MSDRITTVIEWLVERLDDNLDDILEVCHFDTYAEALDWAKDKEPCSIGLVRDRGSDLHDLLDRQWAYLDIDGKLPSHFDGGAKVPARYHTEVWRET